MQEFEVVHDAGMEFLLKEDPWETPLLHVTPEGTVDRNLLILGSVEIN
jgi:hypothetical protein